MRSAKYIGLTAIIMLISAFAYAKTMKVLDIDKGEAADQGSGTEVALSEKHAEKEGGFSVSFDFAGGHGYIGQYKPKKASWSAYTKIKFITFNEGDKNIETVQFFLRGKTMSDGPENSKTWKLVIPPGKKEFEFPLTGQICDDGKSPLDMSVCFQWQFENVVKEEVKFFVTKIWLES